MSATKLQTWVAYHFTRINMVETLADVGSLMKYGEKCVRNTFADVPHVDLFNAIQAERARRSQLAA